MITIKNVHHQIDGHPVLRGIDLTIPEGGITALIGPNGAGKSTLLSIMARLLPLSSGSQISYGTHDLATTHTAQMAKIMAILTQDNHIQSRITVRELLMFGRYPHHQGRPKSEDNQIVDEALVQFQLQDLAQRYLTALSGGQRQRALIAMVFCQGTDYVLLDEPLNNLDMYHARELMRLLHRLTAEQQRTTVVVLHDINQAAAYADHIVAMKNGQVALTGTPDEVFTCDNIAELFGMDVQILQHEGKKLIVHHI